MPTKRTKIGPRKISREVPAWARRYLETGELPKYDTPEHDQYVGWRFFREEVPGLPPEGTPRARRWLDGSTGLPTKRRKVSPKRISIPPAAIDARRAGSYRDLHRAFGLAPCHMSPLPGTFTALGCDPDQPPADRGEGATIFDQSWGHAVELQRALHELAGGGGDDPGRACPARGRDRGGPRE